MTDQLLPSCGQPFRAEMAPQDGPRPTRDEVRAAWQDENLPRAKRTLWRMQLWENWDRFCAGVAARAALALDAARVTPAAGLIEVVAR